MKIYTKNGDKGKSSILNKKNIPKHDIVFELVGTLDELSAHLGILHTSRDKEIKKICLTVQEDLFTIGSVLAGFPDTIDLSERTKWLEEVIDEYDAKNDPLENFILPGGSKYAAHLHIARAVCRRLERKVVLFRDNNDKLNPELLMYVNRLSDLFFVLARYTNKKLGVKDIIWNKKD